MIIYDLRCEKNHTFEGWFSDRAAFETQKKKRLVTCPVCGSTDISQVLSTVATISNDDLREHRKTSKELSPIMALKLFHDYIEKEFMDVGDRFAEIALNIHKGLEEKQNIKGVTTKEEEELLREEGVQFIKVPVPKLDS
ncbi:MAG: DUF1178 family protein [Deltaproteobacteria bacterium]|nr:DUF1178 family protein [Deltaproteobacteria bacterium]MBN2688337.1 DUF1178 family protein [Deltaproteobacteria bacterium]